MPSQSRKHRGYRSQKVLANYLVDNGFPFAESTGAGRSGSDITGCVGIDFEVKARARVDLPTPGVPANIETSALRNIILLLSKERKTEGNGSPPMSDLPTLLTRVLTFILS